MVRARGFVVLTALVAVGAVTGCSSSGGGSSSASGASSSASSSSSAPSSSASAASPATSGSAAAAGAGGGSGSAPLSAEAQQYVSMTTTVDSDEAGFLSQPTTAPLPQIQAAAAKLVSDETALGPQLQQQTWSAPVKPAIDALVAALGPEIALYQSCTTAPSGPAIQQLITQGKSVIAARAAAAAHVHTLLGLPNPTPSASAPAGASPTGSTSA